MNYLDFIIIIVLILSAVSGYRKGFIHQLTSLVALVLGIFIAVKVGKLIAPFVQNHYISSTNTSKVVAFIAVFILVVIAIHWLGKFLEKTFDEIELGHLNKIAGIAFSLIKMVFIISILMVLLRFSIINLNWPKPKDIERSYFYKPIESVAPAVFPYFKLNMTDDEKSGSPEKK